MNVLGLGYAGFGAPDPKEWLKFGTEILGLMPARACPGEDWGMPGVEGSGPASGGSGIADDGSIYLKMDERQWRIGIHPHAENKGLMYLGFEVASEVALEQAVNELSEQGIAIEMGTKEQARARAVTGIAFTKDPAGNDVELFYGAARDFKFQSPLGAEFVTGNLGLGHINLLVADLKANQDFYTRVLGFKLSDYVKFVGELSANFYHCNPRHHTLGITHVGPLNGVHHLMLEMKNIDMVGQCMDRVDKAGINVTSTLGRHTNDEMLSFYMSSPFGFDVEIGCDGVLVDENWAPFEFVEGDIWGHKGLDPITILENLKKAGIMPEE